jgi:hypothetical protein
MIYTKSLIYPIASIMGWPKVRGFIVARTTLTFTSARTRLATALTVVRKTFVQWASALLEWSLHTVQLKIITIKAPALRALPFLKHSQ